MQWNEASRCEYNGIRMEETIIEQILASEEIKLKGQDCENHSLKSK